MKTSEPKVHYLKDYQRPDYLVETVDLTFELDPKKTLVTSKLKIKANFNTAEEKKPLVLDGEQLMLASVSIDDKALSQNEYFMHEDKLIIENVPAEFYLTIETCIVPETNTSLEGLYYTSHMFCTQCEAHGFRRITYFPDRPDIMSTYTTTLIGDKATLPILLSNGNCIDSGDLEDGRHWAKWEDPFKKPCYLFALVAGDLFCLEEQYTTQAGRNIICQIYVEHENQDKCEHAMASLKNAMKWDEDTFGLACDLDQYMIVAVNDFNMGAMENKGLNIFNSKYVLAKPATATDSDYHGIESVIGHEYFHNWTGNRITCRDWFQLSLKEGLTVYRDQEFSADMGTRAVQRINDVNELRITQFTEDAGPLAHPVRPPSYIEMNNFYTATVYNKGAELIRMMKTFVGQDGFRAGMDLYFERHDGQAVTTDDFVQCMQDANQVDLSQFRLWYDQAGTPQIKAVDYYDAEEQKYHLTLEQVTAPTPGQNKKKPLHIPIKMGLVGETGRDLKLDLFGEDSDKSAFSKVLHLKESKERFTFSNIGEKPIPSLLRGFSAPVILQYDYSLEEHLFLLKHDSDPFNRWEAGQQAAIRVILDLAQDFKKKQSMVVPEAFLEAMRLVLSHADMDKAFIAEVFKLPSETVLIEHSEIIDPEAIHAARKFVKLKLAEYCKEFLLERYELLQSNAPYTYNAKKAGIRSLKNICINYLTGLNEKELSLLAYNQFKSSNNMTDTIAAFIPLVHYGTDYKEEVIEHFYQQWQDDALVLDKWFQVQATNPKQDCLTQMRELLDHPDFSIKNPNKVRALIGSFSHHNHINFHQKSGAGYTFLADRIEELNGINPQIAARLVTAFSQWRKHDEERQVKMQAELQRISELSKLSKDVYEMVTRILG